MIKLAFYLFALFICINNISADAGVKEEATTLRKCHVCNENSDARCADPLDSSLFAQTCEAGENYCRKTVQFGNILL